MRNKINPVVSLVDHKHYLEVYVVSFVVQNSFLLLFVPKFIEFSKNLNRDHKALSGLKINFTTAIYKLVDGLYAYEHKKILNVMKSY